MSQDVAEVVTPGVQSTIQDAGRAGFRHHGVPHGGACDIFSFALTNRAAGNPWNTPALECTATGPILRFTCSTTITLGGADMKAQLGNVSITPYRAYDVQKGDTLSLGPAQTGLRTYIAFAGGLEGDRFLGSSSTFLPAEIGGLHGRALRTGDRLACGDSPCGPPCEIPETLRPRLAHDWVLRATAGPDFEIFSDPARAAFFADAFTASPRESRMGIELTGPLVTPPEGFSLRSGPVFPGTVQCPPAGTPFVLLADAQTTGGYPRMAQIIDADLWITGQIRPGDRIWFHAIDPALARTIAAQRNAYCESVMPGFSFNA